MDVLPEWEEGTVAVISTIGDEPHAIPVSTAVRAGPRRVLLALALGRRSLALLRADPRAALTILGRDVAITVHCRASIRQEPMETHDGVAAVALDVESFQDHRQPRFVMEEPVRWQWVEDEARDADERVRAGLRALAEEDARG